MLLHPRHPRVGPLQIQRAARSGSLMRSVTVIPEEAGRRLTHLDQDSCCSAECHVVKSGRGGWRSGSSVRLGGI